MAPPAPPPPAEWALVAYAGPALGQLFPLHPGESILGRAPQAGIGLHQRQRRARVQEFVAQDACQRLRP